MHRQQITTHRSSTQPRGWRLGHERVDVARSLSLKLRQVAFLLCSGLWIGLAGAAEPPAGLGSAFRPQVAPVSTAAVAASAPASAPPAAGDSAAATGLRVVVSSPDRTLATIDGRIVRVGDLVNGMRVIQISPQGVVLRGEAGARQSISLNPTVIKRPANSTQVQTGSAAPAAPSHTTTQTQTRPGARP